MYYSPAHLPPLVGFDIDPRQGGAMFLCRWAPAWAKHLWHMAGRRHAEKHRGGSGWTWAFWCRGGTGEHRANTWDVVDLSGRVGLICLSNYSRMVS